MKKGKRPWEIWAIIALAGLFALCAASVLVYRYLGIAFDFSWLSYRVVNIVVSIVLVILLGKALLQSVPNALVWMAAFSVFHLLEGVVIHFWFKAVIHALILIVIVEYYWRYRTLKLARG